MFFSPAFPLLPVNSDNFSEGESEIIKMGLSQISKEEFNNQSLQVRGQLMEKHILKILSMAGKSRNRMRLIDKIVIRDHRYQKVHLLE